MGGKKDTDLRKEIAMKVHRSKQGKPCDHATQVFNQVANVLSAERRAMFLSKVQAPPSPGATLTPKTPPESPAIFHYSLPSPGLRSPLTAFENEDPNKPRDTWVEQVEFRMPGQEYAKPLPRSASIHSTMRLPSLDQITAHLSHQGNTVCDARAKLRHSARLPAFLQMTSNAKNADAAKPRHAPPAAVGRLQFPVRSVSPPAEEEKKLEIRAPSPRLPPSPSPCSPKLQIKTTVVPRTSSFSPVDLTECNLRALDLARERTAQNMLLRLARRTVMPEPGARRPVIIAGDEERKLRRHSAPPELPALERIGFAKPKLNLPGAF
jgi:hypothetical protein